MIMSEFDVNIMKAWVHHARSTVYAGAEMVWGRFSWRTMGPLVQTLLCLNATAYLNIVDHCMTAV